MPSRPTFDGCLAPKGVCADTATDVRDFIVKIDETPEYSDIRDAVGARVVETDVVNQWAFNKHWEIAVLAETDAHRTQRLRDVLWSSRHTTESPHETDMTTINFHMYNQRVGEWGTTQLRVESEIFDGFKDLQSEIRSETRVTVGGLENALLHEATVRAVSAIKSSLSREFMFEPLAAQSRFLKLVLLNPDKVRAKLDDLSLG